MWRIFRKYHYLDSKLNPSAVCYGLYDGETIVGFMAILHLLHPRVKNTKRCSRLVILPDYQGIGLGKKFLKVVSDLYLKEGYDFSLTTSAKNLIHGLANDDDWIMTRYGKLTGGTDHAIKALTKTASFNRNTASFLRRKPHDRKAD